MCFDYTEIFAWLLNGLNGSIKFTPGTHCLEGCLETFSPTKIPTMNVAP